MSPLGHWLWQILGSIHPLRMRVWSRSSTCRPLTPPCQSGVKGQFQNKISLSSKRINKDLGWITKYYISYQPQPQIQEIPRRFGWDSLTKLPLWCLSSRSAEAPALFAFGRTQKAVWSCCSSSVTRGLKLIKNTNQIWWWSWLTMHQQKKADKSATVKLIYITLLRLYTLACGRFSWVYLWHVTHLWSHLLVDVAPSISTQKVSQQRQKARLIPSLPHVAWKHEMLQNQLFAILL